MLVISLIAVAADALGEVPSDSDWVDTSAITGARIDESTIAHTIVVDNINLPADPQAERGSDANPCSSFREAMTLAMSSLDRSKPVKVQLREGVFRESLADFRFDQGNARTTLLVIEGAGAGKTIWSGSDVVESDQWEDLGNGVLSTGWPYAFGLSTPPWGPKRIIGQRSEMVFVDGVPLRQELIERYEPLNMGYFGYNDFVRWRYLGDRSVEEALDQPDTFAITERLGSTKKLYVRLAPGTSPGRIEVSVRQSLANFGSKQNLVLRGLTITHVNNPLGRWMAPGTVDFSADGERKPGNVLIEDCDFSWNNGMGLRIVGSGWTVRKSSFNYNGFSGISGDYPCGNVVFDNVTTNFNGWRAHRGGEIGWFTGGVKMHTVDGMVVRGHASIGNTVNGFWFDIHCRNVFMQDCVLINDGMTPLMWEISAGPFHARRMLMANRKATTAHFWNLGAAKIEDSIFYNNYVHDPKTQSITWWSTDRLGKEYSDASDADEHIKMQRITPTEWSFIDNVVMNDQGPPHLMLIVGATGRDGLITQEPANKAAGVPLARFTLSGNTYFDATGRRNGFQVMSDDGSLQNLSFDAFRRQFEPTARFENPGFVDPQNNDFRLRPDSPLIGRREELPSYTMPADVQKQMQWFGQWARYSYDAWPPVQEKD